MAQWNQQNLDVEMVRNDTLNMDIAMTDANDQPVSSVFASYARCQVRKSRGDTAILFFETTDGSIELTDGNIALKKSASLTDVGGGKYVYDIEFTLQGTGEIVTPIRGTWVIKDDTTY